MQYSQGYSPQSPPAHPNPRSFYASGVPIPPQQYHSPSPTPQSPPSGQPHPQTTYGHHPQLQHHNTYPQPSGYSHSHQSSQYQPQPQSQPSSPSYGSTGHNSSSSAGYTPVSFHRPSGPVQGSPEQFYGSLFDAKSEPTQIFSRMCDALFFHIDQNCDVPGLRGTGLIEPGKYVWMLIKNGEKPDTALAVQGILQSYYDLARVKYRFVVTRTGEHVVALDREGWLHDQVFEVISDPEEAFKDWTNYLANFRLVDPLTSAPFPTPFPRSAFPTIGDQGLKRAVDQWKIQAAASIVRERQAAQTQMTQALTNAMLGRPTVAHHTTWPSYGTAAPFVQQQPQYQPYQYNPAPVVIENITPAAPASSTSGDHSTRLDTAVAAINLTSTILGAFANTNGS